MHIYRLVDRDSVAASRSQFVGLSGEGLTGLVTRRREVSRSEWLRKIRSETGR